MRERESLRRRGDDEMGARGEHRAAREPKAHFAVDGPAAQVDPGRLEVEELDELELVPFRWVVVDLAEDDPGRGREGRGEEEREEAAACGGGHAGTYPSPTSNRSTSHRSLTRAPALLAS
jgi:hypothetical protein